MEVGVEKKISNGDKRSKVSSQKRLSVVECWLT
jgi:hypothetical protein